jgi:hypothetical protein
VRSLYKLIDDFTKDNQGRFQVIAVDHADIDEQWFQDAIVDNWRGEDKALLPMSWLPKRPTADGTREGGVSGSNGNEKR